MDYKQILNKKMKDLESLSFQELKHYADNNEILTFNESDGKKEWQIEVNIFYSDDSKKTIVVIGSIDDGGLRSMFFPYSMSFEKTKK